MIYMKRKTILAILIILIIGFGAFQWLTLKNADTTLAGKAELRGPLVSVLLPEQFSSNALVGKRIFDTNCLACHGRNAAGQEGVAPPLIHKIYEPSHHGDESFQRAVALGVRAHHWRFGNMPPIAGLSRADVALVITYIRELQRTNGIK